MKVDIERVRREIGVVEIAVNRERRRIRRALHVVRKELAWQPSLHVAGSGVWLYWKDLSECIDSATRAPRKKWKR